MKRRVVMSAAADHSTAMVDPIYIELANTYTPTNLSATSATLYNINLELKSL